MKNLIIFLSIVLLIFCLTFSVSGQTPSFPSAEGDGMYTTGGRGGSVLYVTKLSDDGTIGTLRWAINQTGARIIMFKVAGIIPLTSELQIKNGNLTIAAQSAPGDGICLKNYPVVLKGSNIIIRFLRFRMGDEAAADTLSTYSSTYTWDGADAIWGRYMSNIIIDHCSMSWNIDECSSFYGNKNFSMQWCVIGESLRNSVHSKGAHGYGGIWGGEPATFHHNILAFHDSRNPRFCGSRYTNSPSTEKVNFVNNVIYNWGGNSGYGGEGGYYNIVNNYYRSGIARSTGVVSYRIFNPWPDDGANSQPAGIWGHFYLSGNVMRNTPNVTTNNWLGFQPSTSTPPDTIKSFVPFSYPNLRIQTADSAYLSVTGYAGASLKRDSVDKRIIKNILNGTVSVTLGSNGSTGGFIDSQKDVGGWPVYTYDPASVPTDTDGDGMPDAWEDSHNLNPNDATDGKTKTLDGGYTNVEVYLNELAKPVVDKQYMDASTGVSLIKDIPFTIFPNPVKSGNITVNTQYRILSLEIFTLNGTLLKHQIANNNSISVNINQLKPGTYLLSATLENGIKFNDILIKQ
ncbi:MAG: T9SS type A sorting domain-containing protein [Paludibacteraceae bacterium]